MRVIVRVRVTARARVRARVRVGVRACHAVRGGRRGRRLGGGAARVVRLVAAERVEEEVHVLEGARVGLGGVGVGLGLGLGLGFGSGSGLGFG